LSVVANCFSNVVSVSPDDLTVAEPILRDLSNFGIGLQIGDFGTGYSSLNYIADLPVNTLKIDQSFVERITESGNVVQAIVALGKAMELDVVVEGVETEQQLLMVTNYGCTLAQGFFIGKPMNEIEFLEWCHAVDQTTNDLPILPTTARESA